MELIVEEDKTWTVALESVTNRSVFENCMETCSLPSLNSLRTQRNLIFLVFGSTWQQWDCVRFQQEHRDEPSEPDHEPTVRWFEQYEFALIWEAKISRVEKVEEWSDNFKNYDYNHTFDSWRSDLHRISFKWASVVPKLSREEISLS